MTINKIPGFVYHEGYTRELAKQSVGAGWSKLIDEVFDALGTIKGQIKIIQVKEKWGGLRIYTDYRNEKLEETISAIEQKSFTICEVCGDPGKLTNYNGWYRTLCDAHRGNHPVVEK